MATKISESHGFTLIELMIVIAIIGILVSIAVPKFISYRERASIAVMASDLKTFQKAFVTYCLVNGDFPNDCHLPLPYHLPPGSGMENYLDPIRWSTSPFLGGNYNWDGPDNYPYAGIALFNTTATISQLQALDAKLDDGDLSQGKFRQTSNGRYTLILNE